MSIKAKRSGGWTLVELMMAVGVFSIAAAALASLFLFSIRSFAAMSNYATLNMQNREAMDLLTREVRQAAQVNSYSTNPPAISLTTGDGVNVSYSFNPNTKQMLRAANGVTNVLLNNCTILNFVLFQRNPSNANFGVFPLATNNWQKSVKVIELTWKTSKALNPTSRINSENVQTARIVIRKQSDN